MRYFSFTIGVVFLLLVSCQPTTHQEEEFINFSNARDLIGCQLEAADIQKTLEAYLKNEPADPEYLYCVYKRMAIGHKKRPEIDFAALLADHADDSNELDSLLRQYPMDLSVLRATRMKYVIQKKKDKVEHLSQQMIQLMSAMLHNKRGASSSDPLVLVHFDDLKIILEQRFKAKALQQSRLHNEYGMPGVKVILENEKDGQFAFYYSILPELDEKLLDEMQ